MLLRNSKKLIPGTNGEMTEHDLLILLEKLQAKKNLEYADLLPQCERAIDTFVMIK